MDDSSLRPLGPGAFAERVLRIPARLDRLAEVRRFADAAAEDFGFSPADRYSIQLAVTEAVTNAVQHGSRSEEDPVEIRMAEESGALAVSVHDRGRFIPRVALPDDLPEAGRGLAFVNELMDEVDVRPSADGTTIRFWKRPGA